MKSPLWTPLHSAASEGHIDVVKLLLGAGADIHARDKDGWTPLHLAEFEAHPDVAALLRERGGTQ